MRVRCKTRCFLVLTVLAAALCCMSGYAAEKSPCITGEHEFESRILIPASEEEEGKAENTCIKCGYSYFEILPATGHQFGAWELGEDRGADGRLERRVCSQCGRSEERLVPAVIPDQPSQEHPQNSDGWDVNGWDVALMTSIGGVWVYIASALWYNSLVLNWYKKKCIRRTRRGA